MMLKAKKPLINDGGENKTFFCEVQRTSEHGMTSPATIKT